MFARLLKRGRDPRETAARTLYDAAVTQARRVEFYRDCGVPDSVDGRFEMVLLHVFLVLRRLRQAPAETGEVGQRLFDVMFQDMDQSLREMGVGDLGVGKRIKDMVEAFYGRVSSYETALAAGGPALGAALERNLLGTAEATQDQLEALAAYVRDAAAALDGLDLADVMAGKLTFAKPPSL